VPSIADSLLTLTLKSAAKAEGGSTSNTRAQVVYDRLLFCCQYTLLARILYRKVG